MNEKVTGEPEDQQDPETTDPAETPPVLRVISPDATPEEVAALVAVFSALGGGSAPPPAPRPEWSAPGRMHRVSGQGVFPHAGPRGWRASALPR